MDAQLFEEVHDALEKNTSRIRVNVSGSCPVTQVIWSIFDYTSGPILKMVWDADCVSNNAQTTDSGDETIDGNVSTDSSVSKTGSISTASTSYTPVVAGDGNMYASTSTTIGTEPTTRDGAPMEGSRSSGRSTWPKYETRREADVNDNDAAGECTIMSESCMDSGIAVTTSMDSNLSSQCETSFTQERPATSASRRQTAMKLHPIRYRVGSEDCDIQLEFSKRHENVAFIQDVAGCEEAVEDYDDELSRLLAAQVTDDEGRASASTSRLAEPAEHDFDCGERHSARRELSVSAIYREAQLLAKIALADGSDNGNARLSNEEFVAKLVLAEQISSSPLLSSPLLHKFTSLPARKIVCGSYIFLLKNSNGSSHTSSFSIILPLNRMNWYLKRQRVIEEYVTDTISRFKAAHASERPKDALCRLTQEIAAFFELLSAIENYPLANSKLHLIKDSYLWSVNKQEANELNFIAKAITACLMTKGLCSVVGVNNAQLVKMMKTLCLFTDEQQSLFCIRPYRFPFSPYLRIQAVERSALMDLYLAAADCHWPMAIIDLDRRSVTYSGPFTRHRSLKHRSLLFQVGQIMRDSGIILNTQDEKRNTKKIQIEPQVVHANEAVVNLLECISMLPLKRTPRCTLVDHFMLCMENRARALIQYVKDASLPEPTDKSSALSGQWSMRVVRRSLNLQAHEIFSITLAKADDITPSFAEFYYQTAH